MVRVPATAGSHLAIGAAYLLATLVLLLPTLGDIQRSLGPNLGDPLFNAYVLEWGAHQITRGLPDPWDPPFFFPAQRVLTLSDHLLGPAAAFLVLRRAGLSTLGAYNALLIATFVLGGWVAWWVLRRSGQSLPAAFLGGWVFAFAGYRWSAIGHFQVLRMQWIPAVLWTFDQLLERATPGRAAAFLAFYALHVSGGAYLAVLIHVPLAVLAANRLLGRSGRFLDPARLRVWLPTALLACAVAGFFYLPYLQTSAPVAARNSTEDIRLAGAVLASYVAPSPSSMDRRLLSGLPSEAGRGALFPGIAVLLLAGVALMRGRRLARSTERGMSPGAMGWLAAGLALVLGGLVLGDRVSLGDGGSGGQWLAGYGVPLSLALAGLALATWGLVRALDLSRMHAWRRGLLASGVLMAALCLPTFFMPAWLVVPGMRALRVPTRAYALALFPLAFLVSAGWDEVSALARRRRTGLVLAAPLLAGLLVESLPHLPRWQGVPDASAFPAYTRWIAAHPEVRAYLELPLGNRPYWEAGPMYLQTAHWRPLVNGYSAILPPEFTEVAELCRPFPDLGGLARLSDWGVSHIVVHRRSPSWQAGPEVRARVVRFLPTFEQTLHAWGARRVFSGADVEIYEIADDGHRRGAPGAE